MMTVKVIRWRTGPKAIRWAVVSDGVACVEIGYACNKTQAMKDGMDWIKNYKLQSTKGLNENTDSTRSRRERGYGVPKR